MISDNNSSEDIALALPTSSTNLKNRVSKLYLPKTKPLLPLFEITSNAIHAIAEKEEKRLDKDQNYRGEIVIDIIRNGQPEILKKLPDVDEYPINSFKISDNGIGLNEENFTSFKEFDSEKKLAIGGKGTGRLICLKAFHNLHVESIYFNGEFFLRRFDYKRTKEGFENYYNESTKEVKETGSLIILNRYESEFEKHVPKEVKEIARQMINHFQLYFIQGLEPNIILRNQNNIEINLTNLFKLEFQNQILKTPFFVLDKLFHLFISKSYVGKSHKIHYCAHERTVKDEAIHLYIKDLKNIVHTDENAKGFYFEIFVVGEYLNKNVNEERTGFNFSNDEEEEQTLDTGDITLAKIRKAVVQHTEELLKDVLYKARKEKLEIYLPIIQQEYPNYHAVVNFNKEKVERLPPGLSKEELDLALYEIESEWRRDVKAEGIDIIHKKKDITTLEEYSQLYSKFLQEFNEIGQSDLARYIVHRRSVIDLLDKLIELNSEEKFSNEDLIHSLFFPIRENGNTVTTDKQNLWLIDERLTFNTLLASDKLFKTVPDLNSQSSDRIDLVIKKDEVFENAALFSEIKHPFESFTIVEFKKPGRDDYRQGDKKFDPIKQVRLYIEEIVEKKVKNKGRIIEASASTPFYCYIIADINPSLHKILKYEVFDPTPDGLGFFRFYNTEDYKAYIEVLPFDKIIKDSKQRNKVLFDKMMIS